MSLFKATLALAGYAVYGVSIAANAHATLRTAHVGLLTTDIRLGPPMNDVELADSAQSIQPSLQTLFSAGFANGVASQQRAAHPDARILLEPFSLDDLARTVS